jgi:putative zinc finger/helix-turn-helix YgiT family protein
MNEIIDCAYCEGNAKLHREKRTIDYKKEKFAVIEHFYKCDSCAEEFTTTESDTVTINQAYNQYREKYAIPFPEEIMQIRERYALSASSMSIVLGVGANVYANYEHGEMPTVALSNLIKSASKVEVFLELLESAKDKIPTSAYERATSRISDLISQSKCYSYRPHIYPADEFTGYRKTDLLRLSNILSLVINSCKKEYNDKLKINKVLFYLDFYHYKVSARSITGMPYRAIKHGPVAACYDEVFTFFEADQLIKPVWTNDGRGGAREYFTAKVQFDESVFSSIELESISRVIETFRNTSSWDIVDISHKETGWLDNNNDHNKISYQEHAFQLKAL